VRAREREPGHAVVKRCPVPAHRRVAVRAIGRRERGAGSRVHRVVGLLPVGQVAARVAAIVRSNLQIVVVVDVAGSAGNVRVPIGEQKSRRAVIEFGSEPVVEIVAALAVASRKSWSRARVRRIRRLLPFLQVARLARRR